MKHHDLTQKQLAELVDVGDTTVGMWVRGKTVPSALVMDDVCAIFGCTVSDIYPH